MVFHVKAFPDADATYPLRYLIITPELIESLKADGYTHICFEYGYAKITVAIEALEAIGGGTTTFVLMLDGTSGRFLAGAYTKVGDVLTSVFDAILARNGIELTEATRK